MFEVAIKKKNFDVAMVILKYLVANYEDVIPVEETIRDTVCYIIESGNINIAKAVLTEIEPWIVDDDEMLDYVDLAKDYDFIVSGHVMEDTVRAALGMKRRKNRKKCKRS